MRSLRVAFGCALLTCAMVSQTKADDCSAALIKKTASFASTTEQKLALLSMFDEDTYSKTTKDIGFSVDLPIEEIPVSGSVDYKQFEEKRRKARHNYKYEYSRADAFAYYTSQLDENSVKAYQACLLATSTDQFRVLLYQATDAAVFLEFLLKNPTGDPRDRKIAHMMLSGVKEKPSDISKLIKQDGQAHYILRRLPDEEVRVTVNLDSGKSNAAYIPKPYRPPAEPQLRISERISDEEPFTVKFLDNCVWSGKPIKEDAQTRCYGVNAPRGPMGVIGTQESYQIVYNKKSQTYSQTGWHQKDCRDVTLTDDGQHPSSGVFMLFSRSFRFDENGNVYEQGRDAFNCRPDSQPVGRLTF